MPLCQCEKKIDDDKVTFEISRGALRRAHEERNGFLFTKRECRGFDHKTDDLYNIAVGGSRSIILNHHEYLFDN